jgi:hypothetical protein
MTKKRILLIRSPTPPLTSQKVVFIPRIVSRPHTVYSPQNTPFSPLKKVLKYPFYSILLKIIANILPEKKGGEHDLQ